MQLQKQPAVSSSASSDTASSLAAKVYAAVCGKPRPSAPEASSLVPFQRSGDEWQVRLVVETPYSWSAHRGLITGKSQWSRHAALQLSQWSRHLSCSWSVSAGGTLSGKSQRSLCSSGQRSGDEWQATAAKTLTLQLVSAAGTNGKPQWQRHLAKRNPLHHQYHLHGHPLRFTKETKCLGVTLSDDLRWDLRWDSHITNQYYQQGQKDSGS